MISYFTRRVRLHLETFSPLLVRLKYQVHAPGGMRKLDLFKKIKEKELKNIRENQLNPQSIEKYYKIYRCDGCNSALQSQDKMKYGFIKQEVLDRSIKGNIRIIQNTYGERANSQDSKTLQIVRDVQRELNVSIFNNTTRKLDNLDNIQVLLRLQQKIDQYQQDNQTIKRIKKDRNELFCHRCYSLKYQNKLPEEFDIPETTISSNQEYLMDKIIKKHQNLPTLFLYIIDILDIAGSFKKYIFLRLLQADVTFAIVVNKLDIVNQKYLNKHIILQEVRNLMIKFCQGKEETEKIALREKIENVKVWLVSSVDRSSVKSLEGHIDKSVIKRIQLVGFPNTGKTTLLNQLGRFQKPTSKVPGTTLYVTEHRYKKTLFFDMPGMYSEGNIYNLISKPNLKALLTWNKLYSPPVLLHQALFFGGRVQIKDVKIIIFGLGGACSSDNRWFVLNYKQFWKGLPPLNELQIQKYVIDLEFVEGKSKDLEIAGWGFICFRLPYNTSKPQKKQLTLYLPKGIEFNFRESALTDTEILTFKSVVTKRHRLERVHEDKRKEMENKPKYA